MAKIIKKILNKLGYYTHDDIYLWKSCFDEYFRHHQLIKDGHNSEYKIQLFEDGYYVIMNMSRFKFFIKKFPFIYKGGYEDEDLKFKEAKEKAKFQAEKFCNLLNKE